MELQGAFPNGFGNKPLPCQNPPAACLLDHAFQLRELLKGRKDRLLGMGGSESRGCGFADLLEKLCHKLISLV